MKKLPSIALLAIVAILTLPAFAQDKPGIVAADVVEQIVTVRGVNHAERTVTIATPAGEETTIKVPDQSQNLDQVHVGAQFRVVYAQSVVIAVVGEKSEPAAGSIDRIELAPKGDIPGGTIVSVKEITARVEGIENAARTVSVRGPSGELRRYAVGPEVTRFDNIQVGDTVVLRYTEALGFKMIQDK
jgi:hypothetical protein